MKIKRFFTILICCLMSVFTLQNGCKKEETTQPQNNKPIINSISSNPTTSTSKPIAAGGAVTIVVTATDPENDQLQYTWECTSGSIIDGQNTNVVTWVAPTEVYSSGYKDHIIKVNISDGKQISNTDIHIYVASAKPGINVTPTYLNFSTNIDTLSVKVYNTGIGTLSWEIQNSNSWIKALPSSGTLPNPTDTSLVKIIINRSSLNIGDYTPTIKFYNKNNSTNFVEVNAFISIQIYGYVEGYAWYSGTTIPVSGVTVNIDDKFNTTGSDGYYKLNNVNTGNKILKASKDGYDQYQTNISIVQNKNSKNISMTSGLYTHNLNGTILSSGTLQPIQGVKIIVLNEDGSTSQLQTTSDANGHYQVPTVPQGQRKVRFEKQNFQVSTFQIFMSNSDYLFDTKLLNKPGIPMNPTPLDNSSDIIFPFILKWDCNDPDGDPISYDIYLDETYPPKLFKANLTNKQYQLDSAGYGKKYFWKVIAKDNKNNQTEGPIWTFTMRVPCDGIKTVTYLNKTYNTVFIGNQCWLRENLDVGTMIKGYQDQSNNGTIEKYCYNDDPNNCSKYGGLYQWAEIVQYMNGATNLTSATPALNGNIQGICPQGWHIPTQVEFNTLKTSVGNNANSLKAIGQGEDKGIGTNTSGFSALITGRRYLSDVGGRFVNGTFTTGFWSTTEYNNGSAYSISWFSNDAYIYIVYSTKSDGYSVRCIKD